MGLADKLKNTKAKVEPTTSLTTAELAPSAKDVEEAKGDFAESAKLLEDLRADRNISDIPLGDEYWAYSAVHTLAHGAHALRVDVLDTVKGKPVEQ